MKIDIITNDGSPLGVTMKTLLEGDAQQPGTGGAEAALLTMCETWHNRGDTVRLYNNPRDKHGSPFEQLGIDDFDPNEPRDVTIVFRSPNTRIVPVKNCLRVWWSMDQFTNVPFRGFREYVDKVVCISPFHIKHFVEQYDIRDAIAIDLPVRTQDYQNVFANKVKNRFIFTSVPDRGLNAMFDMWPRIKRAIPDASLVVTSDYRLWSAPRNNEKFMLKSLSLTDVTFLSAVKRSRLVEEQLKAQIHLYPCHYAELFCIAVAESQVAGVYPITTGIGALETTNMGTVVNFSMSLETKTMLIMETLEIADGLNMIGYDYQLQQNAIERFSPETITKTWDDEVFNG